MLLWCYSKNNLCLNSVVARLIEWEWFSRLGSGSVRVIIMKSTICLKSLCWIPWSWQLEIGKRFVHKFWVVVVDRRDKQKDLLKRQSRRSYGWRRRLLVTVYKIVYLKKPTKGVVRSRREGVRQRVSVKSCTYILFRETFSKKYGNAVMALLQNSRNWPPFLPEHAFFHFNFYLPRFRPRSLNVTIHLDAIEKFTFSLRSVGKYFRHIYTIHNSNFSDCYIKIISKN